MAAPTFHLSVVTPDRAFLEIEATSVVLPAHDGEVGVLRHRAPLLIKLAAGALRIKAPEGDQVVFVDGGFAEMVGDRLTVLTEDAARPEEIDLEAARSSLETARQLPNVDDEEHAAREKALSRARARIRLSGS